MTGSATSTGEGKIYLNTTGSRLRDGPIDVRGFDLLSLAWINAGKNSIGVGSVNILGGTTPEKLKALSPAQTLDATTQSIDAIDVTGQQFIDLEVATAAADVILLIRFVLSNHAVKSDGSAGAGSSR